MMMETISYVVLIFAGIAMSLLAIALAVSIITDIVNSARKRKSEAEVNALLVEDARELDRQLQSMRQVNERLSESIVKAE